MSDAQTKHPWGAFLHQRARALRWLRDEMKKSPEETCQTMQMDPGQVRLILMHVDAHPKDYEAWPCMSQETREKA